MSQARFAPQFVEFLPDDIGPGILYVSMSYAVAAHRCACGCGREVVTPLSPTDWKLIFDGENVSLDPSIGNWSFPCRSHYFIRGSKVQWAASMSDAAIQRGRLRDRASKAAHFAKSPSSAGRLTSEEVAPAREEASPSKKAPSSALGWLRRLLQ
ncbi:DUF6527 family protein [Paucibacter sp. DJ2R-2]|uniref:DUF6527 family protein n=1 Tax=Paucibacter sp. DJ2R-2 TaxID=2893558 RepID=UPI00398D20E0